MNSIINVPAQASSKGNVLVIYTGGTFGMVYEDFSNILKPYDFQNIVQYFPEIKKLQLNLSFVSIDQVIDSSNIEIATWQQLAEIIKSNYAEFDGFIVIHGTDTMAYSASAMSYICKNLQKPIIFTGAQLPVSELRSDARDNFITALEIASAKEDGESIIQEVCIYFNNFLMRGNRAKKVESAHFDAFESPNYPILAESGINIDYFKQNLAERQHGIFEVEHGFNPNVAVIKLFPGMSQDYIKSVTTINGLKGIVLETFGSGNAPNFQWFTDAISEAIAKGIVVYNVSQCYKGHVNQNRYETGRHLLEIGVISGDNITTEAAITKLMFILAHETNIETIKSQLKANMIGELG